MLCPDELYRKTDRVDAYQVIALRIHTINTADDVHHLGDGVAGKFITEDENTYFFPGVVK